MLDMPLFPCPMVSDINIVIDGFKITLTTFYQYDESIRQGVTYRGCYHVLADIDEGLGLVNAISIPFMDALDLEIERSLRDHDYDKLMDEVYKISKSKSLWYWNPKYNGIKDIP